MGGRLVWDLETTEIHFGSRPGIPDGLPDKIHCCVVEDVDGPGRWLFVDETQIHLISAQQVVNVDGFIGGIEMEALLFNADLLIGHNIAAFDLPMLEKAYGWYLAETVPFYDTRRASEQQYAKNLIVERSFAFRKAVGGRSRKRQEEVMPGYLCRSHSLKAWGYRLQCPKGEHTDWSKLSPEMIRYCQQDVNTNTRLFHRLQEPITDGWGRTPVEAMIVESMYAYTLYQQEQNGVAFDEADAGEIVGSLQSESEKLRASLQGRVAPRWVANGPEKMPKRTQSSKAVPPGHPKYTNYRADCPHQPVRLQPFNPGSGAQVANHLMRDHGWRPTEFTANVGLVNGELGPIPSTKADEVLELLDPTTYPTLPDILRYGELQHLLGQLAEGAKSWLTMAHEGLIHGRVNPTGTRTSRASHNSPNFNVPKRGEWGPRLRGLFGPTRAGWVVVGCDASGLEMRCLGSVLADYDGGAFATTVLEGDVHEEWRQHTGMFIRDRQKNFSYGMIYGAGDEKRGLLLLIDWREALELGLTDQPAPHISRAAQLGADAKARLIDNVDGFAELLADCAVAFKRGHVVSLDGRCIKTKSEHGTLNDVLQGDGAVVMKTAKWLCVRKLAERGWRHGRDFAWVLDIHDEWQAECPPENAEELGEIMRRSIIEAGVHLKMNIELDGDWKVGPSWEETH